MPIWGKESFAWGKDPDDPIKTKFLQLGHMTTQNDKNP